MRFLRETLVFSSLLAVTGALATPRAIDDCEKITAPMAYNECLASFGPTPGHTRAAPSYRPTTAREPRARRKMDRGRAPSKLGLEGLARRGVHGRVRMEFTPSHR